MKNNWDFLKKFTHARIALGRVGNAVPTQELLKFRLAHSIARDSVWNELDEKQIATQAILIQSQCSSKKEFLVNPDKGRKLSPQSKKELKNWINQEQSPDCVLVLADGLSARALHENANAFLKEFVQDIKQSGLSLGPLVIARYARVALGDEVAEVLRARSVIMLIGERPGLASADSLSVYFTYEPKLGRKDSERNCISNIHQRGFSPESGAKMASYLVNLSLKMKLSGVALKVEYPTEYQRILPR